MSANLPVRRHKSASSPIVPAQRLLARPTTSGDATSDDLKSSANTDEPYLTSDGSDGEDRLREWFTMDCDHYERDHRGDDPAAGGA